MVESDRPAIQLDDEVDRDELRRRYYGLMQELRVLLPGVQILVAFLLTAPFAARFTRLDRPGKFLYAVALGAGTMSVILFATPTVIHRVGERRSRSARLRASVVLFRLGLTFFGIALVSALMVVARIVFSSTISIAVGAAALVTVLLMWVLVPLTIGREDSG